MSLNTGNVVNESYDIPILAPWMLLLKTKKARTSNSTWIAEVLELDETFVLYSFLMLIVTLCFGLIAY